jgi:hypothetical protein
LAANGRFWWRSRRVLVVCLRAGQLSQDPGLPVRSSRSIPRRREKRGLSRKQAPRQSVALAHWRSETLPLLKLLFLGHVAVQRRSAATLGDEPVSRTGLSPRVVISVGLREHSRETESKSRTRGCESGASIDRPQSRLAEQTRSRDFSEVALVARDCDKALQPSGVARTK